MGRDTWSKKFQTPPTVSDPGGNCGHGRADPESVETIPEIPTAGELRPFEVRGGGRGKFLFLTFPGFFFRGSLEELSRNVST